MKIAIYGQYITHDEMAEVIEALARQEKRAVSRTYAAQLRSIRGKLQRALERGLKMHEMHMGGSREAK